MPSIARMLVSEKGYALGSQATPHNDRYRARPTVTGAFLERWGLRIAAATGVLVLAGLVVSDFETSFWDRHEMTSSILASLVVVGITVAVINEVLERRESARWRVFAQNALLELAATARFTWVGLGELLEVDETASRRTIEVRNFICSAAGTDRVATLVDEHMPDSAWRHRLTQLVERLLDDGRDSLAAWGPVMLGARPYTALIERHVELYGRVQLLRYMIDDPEDAELDDLEDPAARARRLSATRRAVARGTVRGRSRAHDAHDADHHHPPRRGTGDRHARACSRAGPARMVGDAVRRPQSDSRDQKRMNSRSCPIPASSAKRMPLGMSETSLRSCW